MSITAPTTRAEFKTRIKNQLGDTSVNWTTEEELNTWVQDCHNDLGVGTGYSVKIFVGAAVANIYRYSIKQLGTSNSIYHALRIHDVYFVDGTDTTSLYRKLKPVSYREFLKLYENKQYYNSTPTVSATATLPTHYCWHGDYLHFYPCPDTSINEAIKIYAQVVQEFYADTDETDLPEPFDVAVVYYACMRQQEKERVAGGRAGMLEYWRQEYERKKRELREWTRGVRTTGPERIPSPDERPARLA